MYLLLEISVFEMQISTLNRLKPKQDTKGSSLFSQNANEIRTYTATVQFGFDYLSYKICINSTFLPAHFPMFCLTVLLGRQTVQKKR